MKAFPIFLGEHSDEAETLLLANVEPRTCGQGSREWFLDRMFSGTSSTLHKVLEICIPFLFEGDQADDAGLMQDVEMLLTFASHKALLKKIKDGLAAPSAATAAAPAMAIAPSPPATAAAPSPPSPPSPPATPAHASIAPTAANNLPTTMDATPVVDNSTNEDIAASIHDDKTIAEEWIKKLSDPEVDNDGQFRRELPRMATNSISWIISLVYKSPFENIPYAAASRKIFKWLGTSDLGDRRRRPFLMLNKDQLIEEGRKRNLPVSTCRRKKKEDLISFFLDHPAASNDTGRQANDISHQANNTNRQVNNTSRRANNSSRQAVNGTTQPDNGDLDPLVLFLDQSFLRPQQKKTERTAASIGHKNEPIFLQQFWQHCESERASGRNNEFSKMKIDGIYRPGLVRNKSQPFVKGSADGIIIVTVRKYLSIWDKYNRIG